MQAMLVVTMKEIFDIEEQFTVPFPLYHSNGVP